MFSLGSKVFLHREDHLVFNHCVILKCRPHLINRFKIRAIYTRYCPVLQVHCRYYVRLNEWGC